MLFVENINIVYVLSIQGFDVIVNALLGKSNKTGDSKGSCARLHITDLT